MHLNTSTSLSCLLRSDCDHRLVEIDGCKLDKMNLEGVKGRVAGEDGSQIYVTVLRREGVKPDVAVTHPYRKQDARRIMVESVAPVQGGIASCPIFAVPKISSRDREARDLGRILCSPELKFRQSSLRSVCLLFVLNSVNESRRRGTTV
jgi:hypothetical protein